MTLFPEHDCDDVTVDCLARLPIQHHRTAAFTSHGLDSVLGSKVLFEKRLKEGLIEPMVYLCLGDNNSTEPTHSWYCLGKKPEKTTVSSGFWLMKLPLAEAESFPGHWNMTSVGSKIYLFNPKVYSTLRSLDCGTLVWDETKSLIRGQREIGSSFLFAIKDSIFVLGGCGGDQSLFPESFCAAHKFWRVVEDPLLNMDSHNIVFLIGSTDSDELAVWSSSTSQDKSVRHVLDSQCGRWLSEVSRVFPFVLRSYSHTFFFGKILLRVIGRKLVWFDDASGEWKDVIEGVRDASAIRFDFRFKMVPLSVVDAGATLVAFGRVGRRANATTIWATELTLEKKNNAVIATTKWYDYVLRLSTAVDVLGSVCVHL